MIPLLSDIKKGNGPGKGVAKLQVWYLKQTERQGNMLNSESLNWNESLKDDYRYHVICKTLLHSRAVICTFTYKDLLKIKIYYHH